MLWSLKYSGNVRNLHLDARPSLDLDTLAATVAVARLYLMGLKSREFTNSAF